MARSKKEDETQEQPTGGRSFKPDVGKFTSIAAGEVHTGFFLGARRTKIIDVRSRDRAQKEILVIKLRDEETDNVKKIACATMLERAWEDVVDEYGNGDEEQANSRLRGKRVSVLRGEDQRTRQGNQIGTYEIIVFDE